MRGPPVAGPSPDGGLLARPSAKVLTRKPSGTFNRRIISSVGFRLAGRNSWPTLSLISSSAFSPALAVQAANTPRHATHAAITRRFMVLAPGKTPAGGFIEADVHKPPCGDCRRNPWEWG